MDNNTVTIGKAAKLSGVSAKAIRLYEQRQLLGPAERTPGGYRTYGPDDLAVLRFIRQARAVGLHLDDIRRILDLQRQGTQPCITVIGLLDRRLSDIDQAMADLKTLRATLISARNRAKDAARSGQDKLICRIIETAITDAHTSEIGSTRELTNSPGPGVDRAITASVTATATTMTTTWTRPRFSMCSLAQQDLR